MKKSLVFKILYLFLVLIVVAGASVFATNYYLASQIQYTDTKSVEEALNELYSIKQLSFGEAIHSETLSNLPSTTRTQELNITKGKYLVIVLDDAAWYESNVYSISQPTLNISSKSTNAILNIIYKSGYSHTNNGNICLTTAMNIYYVEIKDDTDTLSYSYNFGASAGTEPKQVSLHAIPLK